MIPLKLIMKNIGPFNGKAEIDFSKYKGVFLISGDTGAGKTTILDAICYAFYSRTPTFSKKEIRYFRSDFVPSDTKSYVEFIFKIIKGSKNYTYKIYRELASEKNNGEVVKLFLLDENNMKEVIGNKQEIDDKIKEIIKLKYDEFLKIVLLPQGEFANFIKENTKGKEEILKEIFAISVSKFTKFIDQVKNKLDKKSTEVKSIQSQILKELETYNDIEYDTIKLNAEKFINEKTVELKTKTEELDILKNKKNQVENFLSKQDELEKAYKYFEKLKLEEYNILRLTDKVDKAQKVKPLVVKLQIVNELKTEMEELSKKFLNISDSKIETELELKEITSDKNLNLVSQKKIQLESLIQKEDRLKSATEIFKTFLEHKKILCETENNINPKLKNLKEINENIKKDKNEIEVYNAEISKLNERSEIVTYLKEEQQRINKLIVELEKINEKENSAKVEKNKLAIYNKKLNEIEKNITDKSKNLSELKLKKDATEKKFLAMRLAMSLAENEPCPVCGATHHPKLANNLTISDFSFDTKLKELENKIKNLEVEKQNSLKEIYASDSASKFLSEEIENIQKNIDQLFANEKVQTLTEIKNYKIDLSNKLNIAVQNEQVSKQAIEKKSLLEQKLQSLELNAEKLKAEITELEKTKTQLLATIKAKTDQITKNLGVDEFSENINLKDELNKTIELRNDIGDFLNSHTEKLNRTEKNLEKLKTQFDELQNKKNSVSDELKVKLVDLESQCQKLSIKKEVINDFVLDDTIILKYEKDIFNFNKNKIETNEKIKNLEAELKNLPQVNLNELVERINTLTNELTATQEQLSDQKIKLASLNEQHTRYKKLCDEYENASNQETSLKTLYNKINGNNSKNLKFDTWQLSHLFKQVIAFANTRFINISNKRYFLEISSEKKTKSGTEKLGLDLIVHDAHTGKSRTISSLSGGETFIASLCIALGLADTVTNNSGGIKINCMFIDEGFGSLDAENLARVFDSLDYVTKTESLVMLGIISHVSELEYRVTQILRIRKTSVGSVIEQ